MKVLDRVLDDIIDDPDRFAARVEKTAESAARGIDRLVEQYERDPAKARKEMMAFVARGLAKLGKQRLRGPG